MMASCALGSLSASPAHSCSEVNRGSLGGHLMSALALTVKRISEMAGKKRK